MFKYDPIIIELVNLLRQNIGNPILGFEEPAKIKKNLNDIDVFLIYLSIKFEQPWQNTC